MPVQSVPEAPTRPLGDLARLLRTRTAVVLTGAGMSTRSGIPDYRGPDGRLRSRTPLLYQDFVKEPGARARYWSRSAVGWPRLAGARPNPAHRALAALEGAGRVRSVITQNVDGLHQAAGSRTVLELHGSLDRVRCLGCDRVEPRPSVQERLLELNPEVRGLAGGAAPDGDAELPAGAEASFRVPACRRCGGVLKPDVVFFGENVPRARLDRAWRLYAEGEVLLVLGSSLSVYSGRRFVLRAGKEEKPVAIVNLGPTREDGAATVKLEGCVARILPLLAEALA